MKKIISIISLMIIIGIQAQVTIGDGTGTADVKTSVLLEFAKNQNKGIVLPYVRTLPTEPTQGTVVLDATTPSDARVKYYNGDWIDLSGHGANITNALSAQPTGVTEGGKTTIGDQRSSVDGVLVLESTTKAMVLPTVTDVQLVVRPSPGMMVYVNKNGAKRLAVFNGSKWSFWKASN